MARLGAILIVLAIASTACSAAGSPSATPIASVAASAEVTPAATPTAAASADEATLVEGLFDVGGHSLYLKCRGDGSPTIVYMHGSINQPIMAHANGQFAINALSEEVRVCVYDRRNVGKSDTVDAPQLPEDVLQDTRSLLNAAGIQPPYVLLGASFGGLVAYLYANRFPEEVAGMVLLDSMFPDEFTLDYLLPVEDHYQTFDAEDESDSLERISHYKMLVMAEQFIGHEPAIPVTYLSSIPEGFDVNDLGVPEYDAQVLDLQKAFVERFSPGRYLRVDAPHFMEAAIPDKVVDELRLLLGGISG